MLWFGREVNLAPRLLDADGNVISYVVDTWSYERGTVATAVPRSTTSRTGSGRPIRTRERQETGSDNQVCAQQAGLETCRTHNVVNTPIFDFEVLDDDIAEAGRNPGRIRVYRYGPHDEDGDAATGQRAVGRPTLPRLHAVDAPRRRTAGAPVRTSPTRLQSPDITLTPIDDAVAEPEIEQGDLTIECTVPVRGQHELRQRSARRDPGS